MKVPKVVIGANYGDEGKGLITDYLCAKYGADLVIRFNGGGQASHTVVTPSGERHIFSHFGSGTFVGAATFLSHHFVVNPMIFYKEAELMYSPLRRTMPEVYVDPDCRVTTPYDFLINQLIEDHRSKSNSQHGSSGVGFGETITRNNQDRFKLTFEMCTDESTLRNRLIKIRDEWYPQRMKDLGLDPAIGEGVIKNNNIFKNWMDDTREMANMCYIVEADYINQAKQIVFEGCHGLQLDMNYGKFPHVSPCDTGLSNVIDLCDIVGIDDMDVTYVSRIYATRHGHGPLDHETALPVKNAHDTSNTESTYQGQLRYGLLDCDLMKRSIQLDLAKHGKYFNIESGLAVTCLDQLDDNEALRVIMNGGMQRIKNDIYGDVADAINGHVGLKLPVIKSYGPTRNDVFQDNPPEEK